MNIIKLKQSRKEKGYTLSDLSNIIGCTSSYLSQLERGLKQPSLDMLRRISNCLDITIVDLLSEQEVFNPSVHNTSNMKYEIIRHDNRKKFIMPDILTEYEFITPYSTDVNNIVGLCITLLPGKWSCEKLITLNFDFSIYVAEGTVSASVGDAKYLLARGDSIYIHSGTLHNFYNSGNHDLIMVGYGVQRSS